MIIDINSITIDQLPRIEDEYYEYKSSVITANLGKFRDSIHKAVSGFANSGGGYFIVGVDDKTKEVDGGVSREIGDQSTLDWVDSLIRRVEPLPKYSLRLLENVGDRGNLKENHSVLIIAIEESYIGPHMSPNGHYYIRAGGHTLPATHFMVEAIRAKRYIFKPKLSCVLRLKSDYPEILQLGVVSITNAPAVSVSISLSPLPDLLKPIAGDFPLKVPLIDSQYPFFFDIAFYSEYSELEHMFRNGIDVDLEYSDLLQNSYRENIRVNLSSIPPNILANRHVELLRAFEKIEKAVARLSK